MSLNAQRLNKQKVRRPEWSRTSRPKAARPTDRKVRNRNRAAVIAAFGEVVR